MIKDACGKNDKSKSNEVRITVRDYLTTVYNGKNTSKNEKSDAEIQNMEQRVGIRAAKIWRVENPGKDINAALGGRQRHTTSVQGLNIDLSNVKYYPAKDVWMIKAALYEVKKADKDKQTKLAKKQANATTKSNPRKRKHQHASSSTSSSNTKGSYNCNNKYRKNNYFSKV